MALDPVTAVFNIIDKFIPDKGAAAAAKLQAAEMQQKGELAVFLAGNDLIKAQIAVNVEEAKNPSVFVSGWRPAVGWVCAIALFYSFIGLPLLDWLSQIKQWPVPPHLDNNELMSLLIGMLGLGGMRTAEKFKGVDAK